MTERTINEDEMVGFIMRRALEDGVGIDCESVIATLSYQLDFYKEKGLVETEKDMEGWFK